ncbi:unnamed protein product [Musa acuminata var. zebrina]
MKKVISVSSRRENDVTEPRSKGCAAAPPPLHPPQHVGAAPRGVGKAAHSLATVGSPGRRGQRNRAHEACVPNSITCSALSATKQRDMADS